MDGSQRLIAGAMSGTSADGVDVALVRITGRGTGMSASLLHHHHTGYNSDLRNRLFAIRAQGNSALAELARLGRMVTLCYGETVNEALQATRTRPGDVAAIAAHGQTLFHNPPDTVQWLDPALLARVTGCAVVSDFRRADCAVGGQGAPLVPFADFILFRHPTRTRVLLNLGGIANLTFLPAGGAIDDLLAFDTGPANCISDELMRRHFPDSPGYDFGGDLAARGTTISALLRDALADPYFQKPPPKSTDGPAMIALFDRSRTRMGREYPPEFFLRTACNLSASAIVDAIHGFCPSRPAEVIVSGGGVKNGMLMLLLRQRLADVRVLTTDELHMPCAAKEAVAFALLGAATLDGEPSNVPACTGARCAAVLGSITPRPVVRG